MVSLSLWSLQDLCCIRIAYCLWIGRVVTEGYPKEVLFYFLEDVVSDDVKLLTLPKNLKRVILDHIKPIGKHLLSVLSFWISDKFLQSSPKWLTNDTLFECLTLNAYGLINPHEMAKKLLRSRILPNEYAFRLACVNFLEKEVLKLWTIVREYFLKKIVLEGDQANAFIAEHGRYEDGRTFVDLSDYYCSHTVPESLILDFFQVLPHFPFTQETDEVLYWIALCLSKEHAVNKEGIPHFLGDDVRWEAFSCISAACNGNVAYFDYYKKYYRAADECEGNIGLILLLEDIDSRQPFFVFNLLSLKSKKIANLFRDKGKEMMEQFLQWPLSRTFLENPEILWGLLPDEQKREIFEEIHTVLFNKDTSPIPGMYSNELLEALFETLWEISSEDYKSLFMCLFDILKSWSGEQKCCGTSCPKRKLFQLFLSNGKELLEWLRSDNLKKTLRRLLSTYMPEHSEDLRRGCLSFIKKKESKIPTIIEETDESYPEYSNIVYPSHEKFLEYIQNLLLSTSSNL